VAQRRQGAPGVRDGLLARKEAPKGALRFVLEAVTTGDRTLEHSMQRSNNKQARDLLGIPHAGSDYGTDRVAALTEAFAKANDARAVVLALGVVVGAYEDAIFPDMWKNPASHTHIARYLTLLVEWGYQLAEIEQLIVDGCKKAAKKAAA
jgi:hypothetical protein